jgi:hypothetical protein
MSLFIENHNAATRKQPDLKKPKSDGECPETVDAAAAILDLQSEQFALNNS